MISIAELKADFHAGIITATKQLGYTKFTCHISGASWAVQKIGDTYKILAEFKGGQAFSHSLVEKILRGNA
jgi:hypothetical protein